MKLKAEKFRNKKKVISIVLQKKEIKIRARIYLKF